VRSGDDQRSDLEATIVIDASMIRVWTLVSDVCRMSEWSPQVDTTALSGGVERIAPGAKFVNTNSHGPLHWQTHGEVVRYAPEHEVAFRIEENWVIWSFRLERTASGGTRLIQRRETPDGISPLSLELTEAYLGGQAAFTDIMLAGIKATAEASSPSAPTSGERQV
jgi:uncharacterized protein YndB with AHSA1/START domain